VGYPLNILSCAVHKLRRVVRVVLSHINALSMCAIFQPEILRNYCGAGMILKRASGASPVDRVWVSFQ